MNRRLLLSMLAAGLSVSVAGCWSDDDDDDTVADEVASDPDLQTLEEALAATGLTGVVDDASASLTLFAPTNAAFDALYVELGTTKEALFADTALLSAVLTYHVLGTEVPGAAIPFGHAIVPEGGGYFKISETDAGLVIQDGRNRLTNIISGDRAASNGVIHVVDRVLLPADMDVVATAASLPDFSTLVEALTAAGLVATLQGPGPFTVFAPTNTAFDALFIELGVTKEELFADTALLTSVLTYHVLPSLTLAADIVFDAPIATLEGSTFSINASLVVTDESGRTASITGVDVFASNGVIHVLDRVLLPVVD